MGDYIQILTTLAAVIVVGNLIVLFRRREVTPKRFFGWLLLWILVVFFVSYPGLTDRVAFFLGIDRGTDAAFFGAIVLVFYILLKIFTRLERMEQNITKLVREMALRDDETIPKP